MSAPVRRPSPTQDAAAPQAPKKRLLIVDDELDTRGLLEYRFRHEGFEVQTARNGQEALRLARKLQPALIILDIVLPDLDGFSVCDALRTEPETARTPIVLLSSHSGVSISARGIECGIRYCYSKSIDLGAFIQTIRNILAGTERSVLT